MSWFVEGSGGESKCWTSLWNWSPVQNLSLREDGAYSMQDAYANPVECCSLMPCHLTERVFGKVPVAVKEELRTLHDYLHIVPKIMGHTKCLCANRPGFILGQSVQLPQRILNLVIAKKLLDEFL